MASNSDRSSSGSASSRLQKSVERSVSPGLGGWVVDVIERPDQAWMACWSSRSRVIEILRGLAFSATGILSVKTPDA
jgi:hypothetical protein